MLSLILELDFVMDLLHLTDGGGDTDHSGGLTTSMPPL